MKLLADTSALLALFLRNDQNHRAAVEFLRRHQHARFVLTELILAEIATRVRARAGAANAVSLTRSVLASKRYEVLFVDADLLEGALDQMARFGDKRLSLTDCASFETMHRLGLEAAFAFDTDFRDCGFRMLP